VENLFERLDRMSELKPTWIDVTWGAGGSTSKLTHEICENAQKLLGFETMMHMTCTNMPREELKAALIKAKEAGIQNILALRGDPPVGQSWQQVEGGFGHAIDLVKFIRAEHGDYFGICVAGYPEGHTECTNYEEDLKHLKAKIDAGADFIITQLFYDTTAFFKFVKDCRAIGIKCPIVPGIMPIHGYAGFIRMTSTCKTFVPKAIFDELEPIKNDDEAVKNFGVKLGIQMCKELMQGGIKHLHFYTLNLEKSVVQILEGLSIIDPDVKRPLPWRLAPKRKEDVRPIFWAHRPKSYLQRTCTWDEFPNGRWGDSRSPAYGTLTDYHLGALHVTKDEKERKTWWGETLNSVSDVYAAFVRHCSGQIHKLPWVETQLAPESDIIKDKLVKLNSHGFLTINSQPAVNGALSSDDKFGWGPKGGFCYQKAYIEFFIAPERIQTFINAVKQFPSLTYHACNVKGDSFTDRAHTVTAVTWGVFPGKEIVQPTVVETDSFLVWKDEAFGLWKTQWLSLYGEGTPSFKVLSNVIDSYFLVNILDNNYVNGDIFAVFDYMMKQESTK